MEGCRLFPARTLKRIEAGGVCAERVPADWFHARVSFVSRTGSQAGEYALGAAMAEAREIRDHTAPPTAKGSN